jgi:hypothetical protein
MLLTEIYHLARQSNIHLDPEIDEKLFEMMTVLDYERSHSEKATSCS